MCSQCGDLLLLGFCLVGLHFFRVLGFFLGSFGVFWVGCVVVGVFVSEVFSVWVFLLISRYLCEPAATQANTKQFRLELDFMYSNLC